MWERMVVRCQHFHQLLIQHSHLVITTPNNFHLAARLSSAPKVLGYFNLTSNYRLPATCTQPPVFSTSSLCLTFLTNFVEWSPFQVKLLVPQLVKKFLTFCRTQTFTTVIIQACHMSHPEPEESSPLSPILFLYVQFPLLGSFQKPHPNPTHCTTLCSMLTFYGKELLAPRWRITPCWLFYDLSYTLHGKHRCTC